MAMLPGLCDLTQGKTRFARWKKPWDFSSHRSIETANWLLKLSWRGSMWPGRVLSLARAPLDWAVDPGSTASALRSGLHGVVLRLSVHRPGPAVALTAAPAPVPRAWRPAAAMVEPQRRRVEGEATTTGQLTPAGPQTTIRRPAEVSTTITLEPHSWPKGTSATFFFESRMYLFLLTG